jgi:hypothetical protein
MVTVFGRIKGKEQITQLDHEGRQYNASHLIEEEVPFQIM